MGTSAPEAERWEGVQAQDGQAWEVVLRPQEAPEVWGEEERGPCELR